LPPDELNWWYGGMVSSGIRGYFNYTLFHFKALRPVFMFMWNRTKKQRPVEGVCRDEAKAVKAAVSNPVLNTGGYQDAALVRRVISEGYCDGVTIARPLIANNDLPLIWESGRDLPPRPCSFCNRCLTNAISNPLGCYDERRFEGAGGRDAMIAEVMSVFRPAPFSPAGLEIMASSAPRLREGV
jgi:2,4-dienoyl-CoA reductase (NADPH2)